MFGSNDNDGSNHLPDLYENLPDNIFDDEDMKVLNVEPADLLIADLYNDLAELNKESEIEISNNFPSNCEDSSPVSETIQDILMEDNETDEHVGPFEDNFTVNPGKMIAGYSEEISRKVGEPENPVLASSAESSSSLSSGSSDSSDTDDTDLTQSVSPQWPLNYTCDLGLVFRNIHNSICQAISKSPTKQSVLELAEHCRESAKRSLSFLVAHENNSRPQVVSPSGFPKLNTVMGTSREAALNSISQLRLQAVAQCRQLSTRVPRSHPLSTTASCFAQNTEFMKKLLEEEGRAEQHRVMLMFLAKMVIMKHRNGNDLNISKLEDYYSCFRLMMGEKEKSKKVLLTLQNQSESAKNRSRLDRVRRLVAENDGYAAKTWFGLFIARTIIRMKGASNLVNFNLYAKELTSLIAETENWNAKEHGGINHLVAHKEKHNSS